jgi:hypothetical protein
MKIKENKVLLAKKTILKNLESIKASFLNCINQGMADIDNELYNQMLDLAEDVRVSNSVEELEVLIVRCKSLEKDIDSWLAALGQTSISLVWPLPPFV